MIKHFSHLRHIASTTIMKTFLTRVNVVSLMFHTTVSHPFILSVFL